MNFITKWLMKKQYSNEINKDNISKLSSRKINIILESESEKHRSQYIRFIIEEWLKSAIMNNSSLKELKKIIKKSQINLNEIEIHNLLLIEERIFSIDRHIKVLEVSNELDEKEFIGAKFSKADIYIKQDILKSYSKGDLLLSNQRIIVGETSFSWNKISDIKYYNYGFQFKFQSKIYLIRIHDQETLNNTIKNFGKKRVKNEVI